MSYFGKSYHPPGTAPDTLDDRHRGEIEIRLVDFDDKEYVERMLDRAEDCRPYLDRVSRTWIQVNGRPDAETLRSLGRLFDLHELALEDVLNTGQRPKMDIFGDQMFLVLALPVHRNGSVVTEQISIFAGSDYVICFSTSRHDHCNRHDRAGQRPATGFVNAGEQPRCDPHQTELLRPIEQRGLARSHRWQCGPCRAAADDGVR